MTGVNTDSRDNLVGRMYHLPRSGQPSEVELVDPEGTRLEIDRLSAWFGARQAIADVTFTVASQSVTAIIGPSGCGKSTLLRCINRMHELVPGARSTGTIRLAGNDVLNPALDPVLVRATIGMVFQRPNPFPTRSIYDNVAAGPRLGPRMKKNILDDVVETTLTQVGLWNEVRTRLNSPAVGLSGGQQQRLCIARAIATKPEVLLMDEPCSALDPIATFAIEELIRALSESYTVLIVTHNMQQAARVADHTVFMTISGEGEPGRLVEYGPTGQVFGNPADPRTEAYVTGRVG